MACGKTKNYDTNFIPHIVVLKDGLAQSSKEPAHQYKLLNMLTVDSRCKILPRPFLGVDEPSVSSRALRTKNLHIPQPALSELESII